MGQQEAAITDYTHAIRLSPKYAIAYFNRGNIYLDLKNYLRAIADYDSALVHKPEFKEVLNNRGIAKFNLERYTEAIEDYNLAVPLVECDSNLFLNRGNAYFHLKEYKLAIDDYDYAISCNPNMVKAYENQGCALVNLGTRANLEQAIRVIDTALEINQTLQEKKNLSAAEKCKVEAKRLLNRE
jgi:tetratricopeptide (TPR) repeat protein